MTGELTLVGEVLPIGGVREKVLAAKNFGLKHVLLPMGNQPEVQELKKDLVAGLRFHYASTFDEVFDVVFANRRTARAAAPRRAGSVRGSKASKSRAAKSATRKKSTKKAAARRGSGKARSVAGKTRRRG